MSDIYISKIHGAKIRDEELTQRVNNIAPLSEFSDIKARVYKAVSKIPTKAGERGIVSFEAFEFRYNGVKYDMTDADSNKAFLKCFKADHPFPGDSFGVLFEAPVAEGGLGMGEAPSVDAFFWDVPEPSDEVVLKQTAMHGRLMGVCELEGKAVVLVYNTAGTLFFQSSFSSEYPEKMGVYTVGGAAVEGTSYIYCNYFVDNSSQEEA